MLKMTGILAAILLLALGTSHMSNAQETVGLQGAWMLDLENPTGNLAGLLVLENRQGEIFGYVEGGPIEVTLTNAQIELRIDSRDPGARRFERILSGELTNAAGGITMQGTYTSTELVQEDMPPRGWSATPYYEPASRAEPPEPVDLSGIWGAGRGVDMRKYSMDTKPHAEAWTLDYDPNMDQPPLRCLSPGIVQLFGYVYPIEIVHAEDRIFIINEGYAQIREVYMDGRQAPDWYPDSRLGYSVGHWESSTLVVNTTKIKGNIRDFRGEPISDNAVVEERYTLSEDGQYLNGIMTLEDPTNFNRPAIRRVSRPRERDTIILPYECDPDSFYRQLYMDGQMEEYWSRINKRL